MIGISEVSEVNLYYGEDQRRVASLQLSVKKIKGINRVMIDFYRGVCYG